MIRGRAQLTGPRAGCGRRVGCKWRQPLAELNNSFRSHGGTRGTEGQNMGYRSKFAGGLSAWAGADESCEVRDVGAGDAEPGAERVEEGELEVPAGLGRAEHGGAG